MNRWPKTEAIPTKRRRRRRPSGKFPFLVAILVLLVLFLGFKLWEIGMTILIYIYVDWCLKS